MNEKENCCTTLTLTKYFEKAKQELHKDAEYRSTLQNSSHMATYLPSCKPSK